ncbi:MAG: exodeoxyribonuclease III [Caldisericaceae bacterium]
MKIATWNVNSIRARIEILMGFIKESDVDILAIQETKTPDEAFPKNIFDELGYEITYSGQKSYNGVAIASKMKVANIKRDFIDTNNEKRVLELVVKGITIINSYFPRGGLKGEESFFYKLEFYQRMKNYLKQKIYDGIKLIILGDFNVAPEEIDVWNPELLKGTVGFMNEEREIFRGLLDIGLFDAFRQSNPNEKAFSWWDYRAGSFKKNQGMRIDHILVSKALLPLVKNCYIDVEPRKLNTPSDHTPVIIDIDI